MTTATNHKLLCIIIDGVPKRNWLRLFGNLQGWVEAGEAQRFFMRAVLPSISASCYASIHTGLTPQQHGCVGNGHVSYLNKPDVFSAARQAGKTTAAVAHSFWSEFFEHSPFVADRDIEYDKRDAKAINHGRFHTMHGYGLDNAKTPADADLMATLTMLCQRHAIDYGLYHSCTLDSMGHQYHHESPTMDRACSEMDHTLASYIIKWRQMGYQIIVTADHGQDDRGHHGGDDALQRDFALYYFGSASSHNIAADETLSQLQLAPTMLHLLGVDIPTSMTAPIFLTHTE